MKKVKILLIIFTITIMFIYFSSNIVNAEVIRKMTNSNNYKDINWGVTTEPGGGSNSSNNSDAYEIYNQLVTKGSATIRHSDMAKQDIYCTEQSIPFGTTNYEKGNPVNVNYDGNSRLGWFLNFRQSPK